jgi:hypothetical protein
MGGRLALLALLATIAVAQVANAGAATAAPCWQRLVRDWSDGRIDGAYPVSCYRSALRKLPEDLRVYSSAPGDIKAALQQKLSRSSAHPSRGLAVAERRQAARESLHAANGTSLDRPTVLAAALGTFGLALAVFGALARRRRQR